MSFNLDQVMQTFIQEAQELLQTMEECLLQLENDPSDSDNIGAVFRAAHTIKGSAGLFGLTAIVSFTHILEDILGDSTLTGRGAPLSSTRYYRFNPVVGYPGTCSASPD